MKKMTAALLALLVFPVGATADDGDLAKKLKDTYAAAAEKLVALQDTSGAWRAAVIIFMLFSAYPLVGTDRDSNVSTVRECPSFALRWFSDCRRSIPRNRHARGGNRPDLCAE